MFTRKYNFIRIYNLFMARVQRAPSKPSALNGRPLFRVFSTSTRRTPFSPSWRHPGCSDAWRAMAMNKMSVVRSKSIIIIIIVDLRSNILVSGQTLLSIISIKLILVRCIGEKQKTNRLQQYLALWEAFSFLVNMGRSVQRSEEDQRRNWQEMIKWIDHKRLS